MQLIFILGIRMKLGQLERVDLNVVWENEATDFTPWLAKIDNLTLLSDALGMSLETPRTEQNVGNYRADILCKDLFTNTDVLIENQLFRTDHKHLGQILTYAAGLNCKTIVWIASSFTEEHRAALDFLNEITDEAVSFFGIELELWKIGDSLFAPKFNIVSRPNFWTKNMRENAQHIGELTQTKQLQFEYWTSFKEFMEERKSPIKCHKPSAQHWINARIGKSGFFLTARVNSQAKRIAVDLNIETTTGNQQFILLQQQQEEITREFGEGLEWNEMPDKKVSLLTVVRENTDFTSKEDWHEHFNWLATNLELMDKVFRNRIKNLELY